MIQGSKDMGSHVSPAPCKATAARGADLRGASRKISSPCVQSEVICTFPTNPVLYKSNRRTMISSTQVVDSPCLSAHFRESLC